MRLKRVTIAMAMVVALAWTMTARADVLEQVPSNALVVFKIKNVDEANKKIAAFAKELQIDVLDEEMGVAAADLVSMLTKEIGLEAGIERNSDFAFAYCDPGEGNNDENGILLLIPVSDYAAFLGNFDNVQTADGISQGNFKKHGNDTAYIANWGKYAAMSPARDILLKKPDGLKVGGLAGKQLAGHDATLFANFKVLREKLLPELKNNRKDLLEDLDRELKDNAEIAEKYHPVIKILVSQGLNVAEEFLQDANSTAWGVSLTDAGINSTVVADFEPNTYLGRTLAEVKNSEASLLAGLPDGKYLAYGGWTSGGAAANKVLADLLDPIQKELVAGGADLKPIADLVTTLVESQKAIESGNTAWVTPSGQVGQEAIFASVTTLNGDSKKFMDSQKALFTGFQEVLKLFGDEAAGKMQMVVTPQAKSLEGVSFDQFKVEMNLDPQNPQDAQVMQVMGMIYGPDGNTTLMGIVNDKTLVAGNGVKDKVLSKTIATVKAGGDPLGQRELLKGVNAQLPGTRVLVGYVHLDQIVTTANTYAQMFGFGLPLRLPADLPPIGFSAGTEGPSLRIDSHVPRKLIVSLMAAGMETWMKMQEGGMGGGL